MPRFFHRLFAEIRGLPRPVFVLVAGHFLDRFGNFVLPFLALFLTGRGIGMGQVALVLSAMSLGGLFGPAVSGYLADAIGRRNTIVLSLVTSALSLLALYWCDTVTELVVVSAVRGFCAFLYSPAASALLTDLVAQEQRVIAFALMRLANNAGFAVGPALAGLLFTRAPALIFIGDALTTLLCALFSFLWLPHGLRTVAGRVSESRVILRSWRETLADVAANRRFQQYLAGMFFMSLAFVQVFNVLAIHAVDRGLSPAAYGLVMAFNGLLITLLEIPLVQWVRRFPTGRVLTVGYALVGVGCASFAFASSMTGFLLGMALFTLGEMISLPAGTSYGGELAPEKHRGRYFGLSGTVWALAGIMASTGVWFYGQMGTDWLLLAGTFGLVGAIVMIPRLRARGPVVVAV